MQLENQTLHNIRWNILTISPHGSLHRQLLQIIRLQLDTVKSIISPQLLHFLLGILLAHNDLTLLVTGKLVEQILFRVFLPVLFLCPDLRRDRENRHQRIRIQFIIFNFINNLLRILDYLRNILEQLFHLGRCLEPLLPRVPHPVGIIQILACIQTDQQVMRLRILRIQKMHIVRGNHLDPQLLAHTQNLRVTPHLIIVNLRSLLGRFCRMPHHLQVIILPHQILVPQGSRLRPLDIPGHNLLANLTSQTSRRNNQPLVMLLQQSLINTRTIIIPIHERRRAKLDQIQIPFQILGQNNQMFSRTVHRLLLIIQRHPGHVGLHPQNRFYPLFATSIVE